MKRYLPILLLALLCLEPQEAFSQRKKSRKSQPESTAAPKSKSSFKPYSKVITSQAKSDAGLFTVHQVEDDFFFELPKDLLEREILIVSRISGHVKGLNFGGAGMKSRPQQVIRFQRLGSKLLLRSVSYNNVADPELPIYTSVKNNNFEPVIASLKIESFGKDSSVVVKVNSLFEADVPMIGALSDRERRTFKVKGLDKSRSMIEGMKSFPENVIVRHILTYRGDDLPANNRNTETLSIGMTQSMILLPEDPMVPRYYDSRVGYFSIRQIDYGADEQRAARRRYITKWRLVPKDWDAYNRGELVEPVKPIIYYIDPATPKKWVPYIKQGVDDWQKAFEAAGFKNAIMGKEAPTPEEDPEWSPEDVRYSVIRYIATDIQNAQGPHVHDPRTGEILESDILWYHNVMNLLRNWYFIQTAAVNPEAQGIKFKDEIMGQLIRFVAAHEVGHTLGLPHNMGSSPAYPVDSLRSKSFTDTHGTAPSIMDYARFNYIAQPEDGVTNLMPRVGEYDDWSIIYGYKMIPNVDAPDDEENMLNSWIVERADNPVYRYGQQQRGVVDPSAQTEDLGDDAMIASDLGIENLKRIRAKVMEWGTEEGKSYEDLRELYLNIYSQFNRYMGHVTSNVGGVYEYDKTADQPGVVYSHVVKEKQKRAVDFLNKQLFETPSWLLDEDILNRIEDDGITNRIRSLQTRYLGRLMNGDRLLRIIENEAMNGGEAYKITELFTDVRRGIWSELRSGKAIDTYRRNLQKSFISAMGDMMNMKGEQYRNSDIPSVVRANLKMLKREIQSGMGRQRGVSRYHLEDSIEMIDQILEGDAD